jgi:ubiquinone/menaquinone biosynthesis C-methylase UbiE
MRLDVGCRNAPSGDVNVDLPGYERHRDGMKLFAKRIPNFICASVYALPFDKDTFDEVVSYHLLEHLETPIEALREMVRVTKCYVSVVVPAFAYVGECKEHV